MRKSLLSIRIWIGLYEYDYAWLTFLQDVPNLVTVVDNRVRGVVRLNNFVVGTVPIAKEWPLLSANCRLKIKRGKLTIDISRLEKNKFSKLHGLKLTMSSPRPELGFAKRALPLMLPYPVLEKGIPHTRLFRCKRLTWVVLVIAMWTYTGLTNSLKTPTSSPSLV